MLCLDFSKIIQNHVSRKKQKADMNLLKPIPSASAVLQSCINKDFYKSIPVKILIIFCGRDWSRKLIKASTCQHMVVPIFMQCKDTFSGSLKYIFSLKLKISFEIKRLKKNITSTK